MGFGMIMVLYGYYAAAGGSTPSASTIMITEDSDRMITEDGDLMITE